ncbi:hypothetical protein [Mesorhizobium sp. WSM3882]|uniref:hypothetical protein n=1 Tax=Mesorhizobium sp. WSM3882 TaxID=2029407 RepID=UPI000BAFA2E3|nr:hypothetical protein [Mesorhizobium sp. WSM3882]PBB31918.1 hypothetical protein CK214_16195 [Mesorhizobium sp. WSM3882]
MNNGWTFQELIDAGMSVTGGCLDCHRHQTCRPSGTASALMLRRWMGLAAEDEMRGLWRIKLTYSPDTSHRKGV